MFFRYIFQGRMRLPGGQGAADRKRVRSGHCTRERKRCQYPTGIRGLQGAHAVG